MVGAIILGIVAGYVGRLLMPGRDAMGKDKEHPLAR